MYFLLICFVVHPKALDELRGMLANVEFTGAPSDSTSAWQERMERREEAWEAHRPAIYKQMVMNSHMPSNAVSKFHTQCFSGAMLYA